MFVKKFYIYYLPGALEGAPCSTAGIFEGSVTEIKHKKMQLK